MFIYGSLFVQTGDHIIVATKTRRKRNGRYSCGLNTEIIFLTQSSNWSPNAWNENFFSTRSHPFIPSVSSRWGFSTNVAIASPYASHVVQRKLAGLEKPQLNMMSVIVLKCSLVGV